MKFKRSINYSFTSVGFTDMALNMKKNTSRKSTRYNPIMLKRKNTQD